MKISIVSVFLILIFCYCSLKKINKGKDKESYEYNSLRDFNSITDFLFTTNTMLFKLQDTATVFESFNGLTSTIGLNFQKTNIKLLYFFKKNNKGNYLASEIHFNKRVFDLDSMMQFPELDLFEPVQLYFSKSLYYLEKEETEFYLCHANINDCIGTSCLSTYAFLFIVKSGNTNLIIFNSIEGNIGYLNFGDFDNDSKLDVAFIKRKGRSIENSGTVRIHYEMDLIFLEKGQFNIAKSEKVYLLNYSCDDVYNCNNFKIDSIASNFITR